MSQTVYTLLCKRDMPMALITLPKIIASLSEDQPFVVIDDGSFDDETVSALEQLSPKVKVVVRKDREEFIQSRLKNYPQCIAYREKYPFAFKLFDIPLIAAQDSPRYTYTDADIIYLKNCNAYFNQKQNTFLRTDAIKLSFKLQTGLLKHKWKIPYKFNAGYLCYDTKDYDLDFIEYYLGLPEVHVVPWVSEQACWALIFGRSKSPAYCPLENQFICEEPYAGPKEDTLAIHLIGKLKANVEEWSQASFPETGNDNTPKFVKSRNVNMMDWLIKTSRRFSPFK